MDKETGQSLFQMLIICSIVGIVAIGENKKIEQETYYRPEFEYRILETLRQKERAEREQQTIETRELVEVSEPILIQEKDNRKEVVINFLNRYNSPAKDKAEAILNIADRSNVDYKIIIAIAGTESSLWKNLNFKWNAWGWGVWAGKQHGDWKWDTFEQGLESFTGEFARSKYNGMDIEAISRAGYNNSEHWRATTRYFYSELERLENE